MNTYEIKTTTTMKPYNCGKWWIDKDYIKPVTVEANSPKEALRAYCRNVMNNNCIDVSKTAMNKPAPMYVDTETGSRQAGYVVTASTEFETGDYSYRTITTKWVKQYIELWVEFKIVNDAF